MNLLLVADYEGAWPYIPELREELLSRGVDVDLLDTGKLILTDGENNKRGIARPFIARRAGIRWLGPALKLAALKGFLAKPGKRYDVMNIHYNDPLFSLLGKSLNTVAPGLVVSVWGSDFYREGKWIRNLQSRVYDAASVITFVNPQSAVDFTGFYNKYHEKCRTLRFGLGSIATIKEIRLRESVGESRRAIGLPEDSFVITCGYNAGAAQRHPEIIRTLEGMSGALPERTILVLPMTYPDNREYRSRIRALLREGRLDHKVFDRFMSAEDTARLRIATDVAVNIQSTDQFSASIQEHLYAGNVVLTGKWLPYDILESLGVFFIRASDMEDLESRMRDVVGKYPDYHHRCGKNTEILFGLSSWEHNAPTWIKFYESLGR